MVVVLVVAGSMHISTALAVAGIGRVYKEHISKVRGRVFNWTSASSYTFRGMTPFNFQMILLVFFCSWFILLCFNNCKTVCSKIFLLYTSLCLFTDYVNNLLLICIVWLLHLIVTITYFMVSYVYLNYLCFSSIFSPVVVVGQFCTSSANFSFVFCVSNLLYSGQAFRGPIVYRSMLSSSLMPDCLDWASAETCTAAVWLDYPLPFPLF